jgi:hypothetical protein
VEIIVDGAAVKVDGAEPVPYRDISEVNNLIEGLHLAIPPELLGSPVCKACPGDKEPKYSFATNAIAYRRTGTDTVVLVNLCAGHIRIEQVHAGMFCWPLHVLPEPLPLTGQYLFSMDSPEDRALLEALLGGHRDVLAALAGDEYGSGIPAAAGVNSGDAGIGADPALSSGADDGKLPAKAPGTQGRPGAARPRGGRAG